MTTIPIQRYTHFLEKLEFTFTDGTVVVYDADVSEGYQTSISLQWAYNEFNGEDIPLPELTGTQYAMLKEAAEGKVSQ